MTQQILQTENRPIGKRLKGISPLIATLILIAITVVGGILVYHVFFATSSSISSNGNVQIESANIYSGPNIMTLTLKNSGSIAINNVNVSVYQSGSSSPILSEQNILKSPLTPGQTISQTFNGPNPPFVSGDTYTIVINAVLSNGASVTTSTTVTAQ